MLESPPVPSVREITLRAGEVPLSGLLAEPLNASPRALVAAVHGGGMRAAYFHGQAHPSLSLLTLAGCLGYSVLALDRPGYGHSAAVLPEGQALADQVVTLRAALQDFGSRHQIGAGIFLLGHSYGGKLALSAAADSRLAPVLLGADVSGVSHCYSADVRGPDISRDRRAGAFNWGPVRLYPPDTFRLARAIVCDVPEAERRDAAEWPRMFPRIAAGIQIPVRFTFAQYERWWRHDNTSLAEMAGRIASPRVLTERLPGAGHNISLGWAARTYHLRALAFLEECLACGANRSPGDKPGARPATV